MDDPWGPGAAWTEARCRDGSGSLVDLFFSDSPALIERAKAVCRGCPLSGPCLRGALRRQEPWGVWGGEFVVAGRVIAEKRGRGRPRLGVAV